jgi:aspartyl-tRNA(Asn)/glutamyl-tRNA(Gln) amidotransferase subunit C
MKIDDKLLSKLEKLTMLKIDDRDSMIDELNQIVEFVEILDEINTKDVDATFNTLNSSTPMREDVVVNNRAITTIIANAPKVDGNYFIVPKIIEG